MKTIFIMGILSFFCGISAAQPQYWGEGAYDLENVVFGMNVRNPGRQKSGHL